MKYKKDRILRTRLEHFVTYLSEHDRLCGLVVRVVGCRSEDSGSIPGTTRKKVMGLKWGPLSLVNTTE
jgi:hypothetical protein